MPSARPEAVESTDLPRLARRIAWLTAGVGVYRSAASTSTVTSLAASTSRALAHAGSESAWVSRPMNSGPSVPWAARYSDRKSTRLNSSHANISYAVFCLKKKKTGRAQAPEYFDLELGSQCTQIRCREGGGWTDDVLHKRLRTRSEMYMTVLHSR